MPGPIRGRAQPPAPREVSRPASPTVARPSTPVAGPGATTGPAPTGPVDATLAPGATNTSDVSGLARAAARGAAASTLAPGVALGPNGGLVVDGRASAVAAGVTQAATRVLATAAERLDALDENPFAKLSGRARAEVREHLLPFLLVDGAAPGRDRSSSLRARTSAFSLLVRLAAGMRTEGERPKARELVDTLLERAAQETHPGLKRQMAVALGVLPKSLLLARQVKAKDALTTVALPAAPPYDRWFPAGKPPVLDVKQFVQDEFWKSEIAEYRRQGYKVDVAADGMTARATRVIEDPKGKVEPTTVQVELVQSDERVFRDMSDADVDVVLYTGHANLGAVTKWSLEDAPAAKGDKLIGLFACRTKQNLSAVRRHYPESHVMVSRLGTYGHDDRIAIHGMLEGIAARVGYADVGARLKKSDMWERDNYYLPHDPRQFDHADLDGDGVVDRAGGRLDTVYNVDVKRGRGERITMKAQPGEVDPSALDGQKVVDAVQWFNTVFAYWSEDSGRAREHALADRFAARGWFTSTNPDEIVRVVERRGDDGKPVFDVAVNAAYRDQSADALAMMVCFSLGEQVQARLRPDESAHTRRMRAVAMTGSYVSNLVEYGDMAEHLVRIFARRFGFPDGLTWPVLEKAVLADSKREASDKTIRVLERGIQYPFLEVNPARTSIDFRTYLASGLEVLRTSDTEIGRRTFELIVAGKVKIDELSDLTRADFGRLRKEFAREGTEIPLEDFDRLHIPTSRAARAITSSVNGYMWDDRVYVAPGMDKRLLAATLVHEVNHVLNKSEESYRGEKAILVEEYRAHYAEALLEKKPVSKKDFCRALKEEIIENYGLKNVTADDVPDVPPGILLPEA